MHSNLELATALLVHEVLRVTTDANALAVVDIAYTAVVVLNTVNLQ